MKTKKKPENKAGRYIGVHLSTELYTALAGMAKIGMRSLSAEMRMAAQKHVTAAAKSA